MTEKSKQIEMPGFEVSKKPEKTLPQYNPKSLITSKETKSSEKTPKSVSDIIDLIEVRKNRQKKERWETYGVKMIDSNQWVDFNNRKEGKATIFFMFLGSKQYSRVEEMLGLAQKLYSSNHEVADNVLEQVGVYLFSQHKDKAVNKDLSSDEIEEAIDYCLDDKNQVRLKAMVLNNRGVEIPVPYKDD